MKKLFYLLTICLILSSCVTKIPAVANLNQNTILMADNKKLKANYELINKLEPNYIEFVSVQRNGKEYPNDNLFEYDSDVAMDRVWSSYFQNIFNEYAEDEITIIVTLNRLAIYDFMTNSTGNFMLTGNTKSNVEAIADYTFEILYNGDIFKKDIQVKTSDYNETQQMSSGSYSYSVSQKNPTQQKAAILEGCFNRGVILFDNYLTSIIE